MHMYLYYMYLKINSLTTPPPPLPQKRPRLKPVAKINMYCTLSTGVWPILDSYLIFKALITRTHVNTSYNDIRNKFGTLKHRQRQLH